MSLFRSYLLMLTTFSLIATTYIHYGAPSDIPNETLH